MVLQTKYVFNTKKGQQKLRINTLKINVFNTPYQRPKSKVNNTIKKKQRNKD